METLKVGNLNINKNKCIIIAEAGVNHNCSLKMAERLIKEAKKNGADIIKFQTYKADKLSIRKTPRFWNWEGELIKEGTQYDSYKRLDGFNEPEYKILKKLCKRYKIQFMSTPFDNEAVDMLDRLGVSAFKVASCDITNFPLLKKIAQKKKPMFVSTGASNINEIKKALNYILQFNKKICLMQCTLSYPTKPEDANLLALNEFKKNFKNVLLGLSDHTLGYKIAASSVLLGVRAIEKHYTYDKGLKKSADHWLSINSQELNKLRKDVDLLVSASGDGKKRVLKCEHLTRKLARRSLVTTRFIQKGEKITDDCLIPKRPGTGISPDHINFVIGKKAKKNIQKDTILKKNHF